MKIFYKFYLTFQTMLLSLQTLASSSVVEPRTVNPLVAGSNPALPARTRIIKMDILLAILAVLGCTIVIVALGIVIAAPLAILIVRYLDWVWNTFR
jgi:hypothetical protein